MNDKRILVVDDDDAIRALLLTIFRRRGFKLDSARNGTEAMERLARCHYCVMLLDLMMPQMNGYEVLEEIAKIPAEQRPIILVFTAGTEPRNLSPDLVSGTMRKPFDIELLTDTISACINIRDEQAQSDDCPTAESECSTPPNPVSRNTAN